MNLSAEFHVTQSWLRNAAFRRKVPCFEFPLCIAAETRIRGSSVLLMTQLCMLTLQCMFRIACSYFGSRQRATACFTYVIIGCCIIAKSWIFPATVYSVASGHAVMLFALSWLPRRFQSRSRVFGRSEGWRTYSLWQGELCNCHRDRAYRCSQRPENKTAKRLIPSVTFDALCVRCYYSLNLEFCRKS
ncbi:hypothetical protein Tcan_00640, partial [Toxocara canis]